MSKKRKTPEQIAKRIVRRAEVKALAHYAAMAAMKLTSEGYATPTNAGYAVIAIRIRDAHPEICGNTKKVITEYAGGIVKSEEDRLAELKRIREEARTHWKPRPTVSSTFYASEEWRRLRYQALRLHGARCQCCGVSSMSGAVMHVDHIKPRSKFPDLALVLENLQVLCAECNLGKSNLDDTDWRPNLRVITGGA